MSPSSSAPISTDIRLLATTTRRVNTHSGRIALPARRSTSTNSTSASAPPPKTPMLTGEDHAHACPPSSRPRITAPAPTVSRPAPR
ncbi:Uncharacterised protein [Mycobacteroides abscessus subsp. abscessus]|nr:Uncharacterised protein [Mycobacteroides abscessus subsp. abscessus]